jgi:malate dehydrogenase (oxaloacetate-decarboxylating)
MYQPRIEVRPAEAVEDAAALSRVYTPGVADDCRAIAGDPDAARRLTTRGNSVAVASDGSAVLGLGDIGPQAALPVLEGKAALLKRFAGVDGWPLCVDVRDPEEMAHCIAAVAAGFGGICLEDIAAPRCFAVERHLQDALDVPVVHDDQHGTAIVVLAALQNALRLTGKRAESARIVVVGAGAAGTAIVRLLTAWGVSRIAVYDVNGLLHPGRDDVGSRDDIDGHREWLAGNTQPDPGAAGVGEALAGADVFIGVSGPGVIAAGDIAKMADRPVIFALANPDPEIDPEEARQHAAVVATGRSDEPNQINNVLAFPGLFRGLLDRQARELTAAAQFAAAQAIADTVSPADLDTEHIVPSVFDERLVPAVAAAVARVSS